MKRKRLMAFTLLLTFAIMAISPGLINQVDHNQIDPAIKQHMLSAAPTVAASAAVVNADDTDNLYARYKAYTLTANATDADSDLDHVNISLIINGGAIQWTVTYTNATDTFTEGAGAANIELVTGSSWSNRTATAVDLTISVKIEWVHADIDNVILQTIAWDGGTATTDNSSAAIDVISSVAVVNSTISDARGNAGVSNLNITGTVVYCDSATLIKPATGDCDVWITSSAGNVSDLAIASGVFSNASVPASSAVGLNTYTINVVAEAGGVSATSQTNATYTETYISDKVLVTYLQAGIAQVHQGEEVLVYFDIVREYDSSAIVAGTVTLEGYAANFLSGSQWYISVINQNDVIVTFDTVVITGETYGITTVNMNSKDTQAIWEGTPGGGGAAPAVEPPVAQNPFITINPDGSESLSPSGSILILGASGFVVIVVVYMFFKPKK